MKAPINAAAPPAIHAPIISSRVDVQEATIAGVTKIPEPTIPPITTMVASKKPMRRASRSSGTRTLYHARAGLAGPRSELQPRHGGYRHIPWIVSAFVVSARFILFLPENLLRTGEQLGCFAEDLFRRLHGLGRRRGVGRLQEIVNPGNPGVPGDQRRRLLPCPGPALFGGSL